MSCIKFLFMLICLLGSSSFYAQSNDSVLYKYKDTLMPHNASLKYYFSNFKKKIYTINLDNLNSPEYKLFVSQYNKTTNSFDSFLADGSKYLYINSNMFFVYKHRVIDPFSGKISYKQELLLDRNRDSFNPHGADDFSSALISGFIDLLFSKF